MPDVQKAAENSGRRSWFGRILPALTLMVLAPTLAEVLPGATRVSALIGFPPIFIMEVLIWGSGAVLARYIVRRFKLGWFNLVILAVVVSLAEELLIQQTSFAPVVVQIKGVEYGRAFGFNYVYFVWAVLYEAILVVCAPVAVTEMLFPSRKDDPWLNRWSAVVLIVLMVPASFAAWYGWNIMARPNVFHLPPYYLPRDYALMSAAIIAALVVLAVGPTRRWLAGAARPQTPPHPLLLAVLGVAVAGAIFAIEVLAFGAAPEMPSGAPVAAGIALGLAMLATVPGWMASERWTKGHLVAMTFSVIWANFAFLFIGFGGGIDLYGKIVLDILGVLGMIWIAVFYLRHKSA